MKTKVAGHKQDGKGLVGTEGLAAGIGEDRKAGIREIWVNARRGREEGREKGKRREEKRREGERKGRRL